MRAGRAPARWHIVCEAIIALCVSIRSACNVCARKRLGAREEMARGALQSFEFLLVCVLPTHNTRRATKRDSTECDENAFEKRALLFRRRRTVGRRLSLVRGFKREKLEFTTLVRTTLPPRLEREHFGHLSVRRRSRAPRTPCRRRVDKKTRRLEVDARAGAVNRVWGRYNS